MVPSCPSRARAAASRLADLVPHHLLNDRTVIKSEPRRLTLTSLSMLLQAVHELVPPETLAPVLKQLADQFINDRTRPEVMVVGMRSVRELTARAPLIMTPDLLQVGCIRDSWLYSRLWLFECCSKRRCNGVALHLQRARAQEEQVSHWAVHRIH